MKKNSSKNVALHVETGPNFRGICCFRAVDFSISAYLSKNMRREGFELSVGKPEVIVREIDGPFQRAY